MFEDHQATSDEQLEEYRKMTCGQRLALTFKLLDESFPLLLRGSKEVVDQRFELLDRENDARNRALLEGLVRAGQIVKGRPSE